MLGHAIKNPRKITSFARKMQAAHELYQKPYGDLLRRFLHLCREQQYSPREVFLWDLLGPQFADGELDRAMSKTALVGLQRRLNPPAAAALTEDKSIFYSHCRACGLPSPRLFAVIGPPLGWTAEGAILRGERDWARFFEELTASDIVIKPVLGVYGRGVHLLRREGADWVGDSGRRLSPAQLAEQLRRDSHDDRFIVQERVACHPRLVALSGSDFLQTLRIITVVTEEHGAEIIFAFLKVIGGSATTDNFSNGAAGNLLAPIALATGKLTVAKAARPGGVGLQAVPRHPVTGAVFADFDIPFWEEACALARKAATSFLPLVTIGWDVAISPEGPLLIEGNAWWDPILTIDKKMHVFRAYARRLLENGAA